MIKRHPDIFLKSWASFEAKINYITKVLGRALQYEKAFPLLLAFDYSTVIKPRCEILREQNKVIKLEEILPLTDEKFCLAYNVTFEELDKKIGDKKKRKEKDVLWAYVPGL